MKNDMSDTAVTKAIKTWDGAIEKCKNGGDKKLSAVLQAQKEYLITLLEVEKLDLVATFENGKFNLSGTGGNHFKETFEQYSTT